MCVCERESVCVSEEVMKSPAQRETEGVMSSELQRSVCVLFSCRVR